MVLMSQPLNSCFLNDWSICVQTPGHILLLAFPFHTVNVLVKRRVRSTRPVEPAKLAERTLTLCYISPLIISHFLFNGHKLPTACALVSVQ